MYKVTKQVDTTKKKFADLFKERTNNYLPNSQSVHEIFRGRDIVLYGAGGGFITFTKFVMERYNYQPTLILDLKFTDVLRFQDVPSASPIGYKISPEKAEKTVVVITIGDPKLYPEIYSHLEESGFTHIFEANDIYEYHLHYTSRDIETAGRAFFLERFEIIKHAFDLMSDDESREVFTSMLATHMRKSTHKIPSHPLSQQYFPQNVPLSKGYQRVINCGAFDGDTVRSLHRRYGKIQFLACIEPDPFNFRQLSSYLKKNGRDIASVIVSLPVGIFHKTCSMRFGHGRSFNSSLDENGESLIQCVSLDDILPECAPTFINMDIEGAEVDGLIGCEKTIREHTPDLAICVYHSTDHLWRIPMQVAKINKKYRFYLRNYTGFVAETVLYATIPESS
jgi:FkbM family methyltransferase